MIFKNVDTERTQTHYTVVRWWVDKKPYFRICDIFSSCGPQSSTSMDATKSVSENTHT